jgi:hypothetical protein
MHQEPFARCGGVAKGHRAQYVRLNLWKILGGTLAVFGESNYAAAIPWSMA